MFQCLVYIDMNMVRAGVVNHPCEWSHSGYQNIQQPPARYSILDLDELMRLGSFNTIEKLQKTHRVWIETELEKEPGKRQALWTESLAVGRQQYVERVRDQLSTRAQGREVSVNNDKHIFKEPHTPYRYHFSAQMVSLSD